MLGGNSSVSSLRDAGEANIHKHISWYSGNHIILSLSNHTFHCNAYTCPLPIPPTHSIPLGCAHVTLVLGGIKAATGQRGVNQASTAMDVRVCCLLIVGNEGIRITSPNYPNNYPNSEDCVVTINAVTNECKLEINCDDFQIQDSENCRKDFLLIREDRLTKEKFCGNEEFVYMSNKETLKLRFRSNRQITDKGFSCFVRSVCPTCNIGSCQCGVVNSARIVGGEEVDPPNNYPWHVGIKFLGNSNYWCGGSIINDQYVLTAAHCVDDITSIEGLVVGVADHNMASTDEDIPDVTRLVAVQEIIVHPDYNSATIDSDIALLRLSETLDVYQGDQIRPVCLPADDSSTYAGEMATATGWGTLESGGSQSSVLQEVTMPILEPSCPGMPSSYITENMLCAGLEEGGKDTCQGDSGGPLVQNYFSNVVSVHGGMTRNAGHDTSSFTHYALSFLLEVYLQSRDGSRIFCLEGLTESRKEGEAGGSGGVVHQKNDEGPVDGKND
ncbi:Ovochymase-1 [Portunus trituberculatus]|uniref:Ovochymase-1 n=1 Tax=Portunus trituberculatus TaxID=210409 RepID=A0A5B7FP73_PORTR|nr:Ovochymase-1 [Portunus trituberculatus]